ncbi:hypothetical protein JCM5296_003128 [Sporobolomyces johnsonii]
MVKKHHLRQIYNHKPNSPDDPDRAVSELLRNGMPWVAAVFAGVMAFAMLPSFVEIPAIVGAIFCGLTGIAAVVGWFMLRKGEAYHKKQKNVGRDPATLKHQRHPIFMIRYVLFAVALAMFITEGSYLYTLSFVLADNDSDYCVTFSPATSKKECSNSAATMGCLIVGLLLLAVSAWTYEHVVTEAVAWFDYRKEQHASNYRRNGGQPSSYAGAGGQQGRAPPAYGDDDQQGGGYQKGGGSDADPYNARDDYDISDGGSGYGDDPYGDYDDKRGGGAGYADDPYDTRRGGGRY